MNDTLPLAAFLERVGEHPDRAYLHQPVDRHWTTLTWDETNQQARKIASGLLAQGFNTGDRIGILAKNSVEWFIADIAIMMAGMISVPIYATANRDTIEYIVEHSQMSAIFIGKLDNNSATLDAIPASLLSVAFPYEGTPGQQHWLDWLGRYSPLQEVHQADSNDTYSIIYTSGSTGVPKGVVTQYSHVAAASSAATRVNAGTPKPRYLSYLPLAHITERCVIETMSWYSPMEIFFCESLETFILDVQHARPTLFISVPRLWVKFQHQILAKVSQNKLSILLALPIISDRIRKKIQRQLGLDQVVTFASGSAPISTATLNWFQTIGIDICEGWGMTETTGVSCINFPFDADNIGTIGMPQSCVEMTLSEDGEILIRGDAVFDHYYCNPEATQEAFSDDWFHTGDLGSLTATGAFKIIGRVKEQFKTSKGKYVSPVPIENRLARNPLIEQVCVLGSGRKQPLALVVLTENTDATDPTQLQSLQATIKEVNRELESHQQIDHLVIVNESWTPENDLLTPTLKLRRVQIETFYQYLADKQFETRVVIDQK